MTIDYLGIERQVLIDLRGIVRKVETLTGLRTRWSGELIVSDEVDSFGDPAYRAKFGWDHHIYVHFKFLRTNALPGSLLHEAFHSVSAGVTRRAYIEYPGFEERSCGTGDSRIRRPHS